MLLREQIAGMQNIFLNNGSENHFAFTNNGSDLLMLLISYHQFLYLCTLHNTSAKMLIGILSQLFYTQLAILSVLYSSKLYYLVYSWSNINIAKNF